MLVGDCRDITRNKRYKIYNPLPGFNSNIILMIIADELIIETN